MSILDHFLPSRRRVMRRREAGREIYNRLAERAEGLAVGGELVLEDDFDLRFEILVLLASGTLFIMKRNAPEDEDSLQAFWEEVYEGFDHSLRQRGVTDIRMAATMRKLLVHGTGRRMAYLSALESDNRQALREAAARNVLNGAPADDPRVDRLLLELDAVLSEAGAARPEPIS